MRIAWIVCAVALAAESALAREVDLGAVSGIAQWGGREPHLAVVNPVCGQDPSRVLSLDGEWDFTTPEREGRREMPLRNGNCTRYYSVKWKNPRKISVPSCWEAEGVGAPGTGVCWAAWWDNSAKPLRHAYQGTGWYRRTVTLPAEWQGCRVWIKLGGIKSAGYVWVNDRQVALVSNYCGTEKYEITDLVRAGAPVTVSIQVDNRIPSRKGLMSNAHCFGGIYRGVELEATPQTFIDDAWVRGDFDGQRAEVKVKVEGLDEVEKRGGGGQWNGSLSLRATVEGETKEIAIRSTPAPSTYTLEVPLRIFRAWSPEHPNLYTAAVELVENGQVVQRRNERFGVRKIEVRGKEFYLNGRPFFARGFGDDHIYPMTGLSPADRQVHFRHLSLARRAGFNLVRLHTHCELPEYFEAADEAGVLVQPELPYYSDEPGERFAFDPKGDVTELWRNYRRHPSFAIYSMGNEGSFGPDLDRALHRYVKAMDPDRLKLNQDNHQAASNPPDSSDFQGGPKTIWPRGSVDPDCPFVAHEYMNLCVKFDVRQEGRYTGVWMPPGTRAMRAEWLAKSGLDAAVWGDRLQDAQHALQAIWQKCGIEAARMDPHCDGYSFWTIVDVVVWNDEAKAFSAQGLLDPFWCPKRGGFTPEEFAVFNSASCVLVDTPLTNRVYGTGDVFAADVLFSHYGDEPLPAARLDWRFVADGKVLCSDRIELGPQALGAARKVCDVKCRVPQVDRACKAILEVVLSANGADVARNSYDHWFFPKSSLDDVLAEASKRGVTIALEGSDEAKAAERENRPSVIISGANGKSNIRLGWWWMGKQMGMVLKSHPALKYLPHEGCLSPLLFRIVKEGRPLPAEGISSENAIVVGEGATTCYSYLSELQIGRTRVMRVDGLDLLADTPEGNAILKGLVEDVGSGN